MSNDMVPGPELTLAQRLNGAMVDLDYIQRDNKVVPGMGFRPLGRQAVVAKVRPVLRKWGIAVAPEQCVVHPVLQYTTSKGAVMFMHTIVQGYRVMNANNPCDHLITSVCAVGVDSSDRGANKALTSSEKQLFVNLFHIEIGDGEESPYENDVPDADDVALLSAEQRTELAALAEQCRVPLKMIAETVGFKTFETIEASHYQNIKGRLLTRLNQLTASKQVATPGGK